MQPIQKKVWQKPEIIILDTDDSVNVKGHPSVKESTGFQFGGNFATPHGGASFTGTKNQAAS